MAGDPGLCRSSRIFQILSDSGELSLCRPQFTALCLHLDSDSRPPHRCEALVTIRARATDGDACVFDVISHQAGSDSLFAYLAVPSMMLLLL